MTNSFNGTYGSKRTPCTVFTYTNRDGSTWYAAEGSVNVNKTFDEINEGVNIEELSDSDMFTAGGPINSEDALDVAIES